MKTRLREIRLDNKLDKKDMAAIIGSTGTTYSNWESGRTEVSIEALIKISEHFGVTVDYLLYRDAETRKKNPMEEALLAKYGEEAVSMAKALAMFIDAGPTLSPKDEAIVKALAEKFGYESINIAKAIAVLSRT